jgi:probable F420-dependent oxidoreductase
MKIGLMIYTENDRLTGATRPWTAIRAAAQQAEADGFDSIWLADHLWYAAPGGQTRGAWESWTILTALAEATERVQIGTLVACNAFRNPAVLAKMATTLDEVSGGRLVLGVGAGWNEPEHRAFGLPFDHRVDRFEEALQILRPMLRDGEADFTGQYHQVQDCRNEPRGPRPDGPPLMVGSFGPRMMELTARYADVWNTGAGDGPESLERPLADLDAACREIGRDPSTIATTATVGVFYPDLRAELPPMENPLIGTAEEIAAAIHDYAALGLDHLMFLCEPHTAVARGRLAEALGIYRRQVAEGLAELAMSYR